VLRKGLKVGTNRAVQQHMNREDLLVEVEVVYWNMDRSYHNDQEWDLKEEEEEEERAKAAVLVGMLH